MKIKLIIITISIGLFTFSNATAQEVKQHEKIVEQITQGSYTCPMHSEVTQNKPGSCSKCGMDLQKVTNDKAAKSSSCCPSASKSKKTKEKASCGMKKEKMKMAMKTKTTSCCSTDSKSKDNKEKKKCGMKNEMKSK